MKEERLQKELRAEVEEGRLQKELMAGVELGQDTNTDGMQKDGEWDLGI